MKLQDIGVECIDCIDLDDREFRDCLGVVYDTKFRIIAMMGLLNRKQKMKMDMELEKIGLTVAQAQILFYIMLNSGGGEKEITARDLEQRFQVSNPTISGILKRLEKKEFIERTPGTIDRRKQQIRIKGDFHYLRKNAEERMEAEKEKLFRDFTEEDLDKLSELLKKLLYNIEDRNEE